MTIFDNELVFPGGEAGPAPRLADFIETVEPRLAALYDENGDIGKSFSLKLHALSLIYLLLITLKVLTKHCNEMCKNSRKHVNK